MRYLGRIFAAITLWAAAGAAFAQAAALEPANSQASSDASIAVAPMVVTQVSVTPDTAEPAPAASVKPRPPGPPPIVAVPQAVYVTHFVAVPAGAPPSGLLARLRAALHAHAAGREAGLVAQAVVQRLNHAGLAARYLAPGEALPVTGWLVGGVFHVRGDAAGSAPDGAASENETPEADVSVTVADLEHGPDTPFALLGTPIAESSDAGHAAAAWRPYVVPAQLAFEKADRNTAVAALAQQIVNTFVGNMTALRQADARAISP
ncbi:MAG TPA: hypothetical protein VF446_09865 [Trinickia sp.]